MPRLRAFILGLLLLAGLLAGTEYALRERMSLVPAPMRQCPLQYGWIPSERCYLEAPAGRTIEQVKGNSLLVTASYDEYGLRITNRKNPATAKIELLCLGNERILAPLVPDSQTFTERWQALRQADGDKAGTRIANAGMPEGCPLLWGLQSERLQPLAGSHWLCFIGPETILADFKVRRVTQFNAQGQPVLSRHPYVPKSSKKTPTVQNPLQDYQLFQLALPQLCNLFLGENPATLGETISAHKNRGQIEAGQLAQFRLALEPMQALKNFVAASGGRITLIYLPSSEDLLSQTKGSPLSNSTGGNSPTKSMEFRHFAREFASHTQIHFLDLTPLFISSSEQTPFVEDGSELSPAGHELLARGLENSLFPPLAEQNSGSTPSPNALESSNVITR